MTARHGNWRGALALATTTIALGLPAAGAAAKTYVVNPAAADATVTSNPCETPCSLRQAIADAGGSLEAENHVEVPPGNYTLTQGPLEVIPHANTTLTIFGRASRAGEVVISAGGSSRVMSVGSPVGGAVGETVLSLLEITGGAAQREGGGIHIESGAALSLTNVSVDANFSTELGGGIYVGGSLDVLDSVIARNEVTASRGGGVYADGPVSVVNSTIAENHSAREGGGVYDQGGLTLASATVAGNTAGEGGGGGVAGNAVTALDSLLAENKPQDCAAKVEHTEAGHDLADDESCNLSSPGDKQAAAELVEEGGLPKLADNGGPTETIALQASSPAVGGGNGEACPSLDQRGVERPKGLCDVGAFQLSKQPASSGAGQHTTAQPSSAPSAAGGPPPAPLPPPVLARTGDIAPVSGSVSVELPGSHTFVALSSLREVPFGTVVDATHGRVVVTTAGPHGTTQTGEFFAGEFVLSQGHNGLVVATLTGGSFSVCPTARERSHVAGAHAAHASGSHVVRKLWANAHGSFSTKGNYAAGAVVGTEWLTEDLCDGTLIRVTRDRVRVTNLVNHRHFTVRAGHSHLAKAP